MKQSKGKQLQQVQHHKGVILFLLICLVVTPFCLAAPPLKAASFTNDGIIIISPAIDYKTLNQSFNQNVHIVNKSNGAIITNAHTTCIYHLYNNSGEHLTILNITYNPTETEWEVMIDSNNFSHVGQYSRVIICNYTHGSFYMGDISEFSFYVNSEGRQNPSGFELFIMTFLFISILIFMVFTILWNLEGLIEKSTSLRDVSISISFYFVVLSFNFLNYLYFNSTGISEWMDLILTWTMYTHVIIPFIGFLWNYFFGKLKQARSKR